MQHIPISALVVQVRQLPAGSVQMLWRGPEGRVRGIWAPDVDSARAALATALARHLGIPDQVHQVQEGATGRS
jgi:hypothetical protein